MFKTEVLIVGGGVAGLSTAYFLGKSAQRSVTVLEQEKRLGAHASGRNAGMLRQAVPDPLLASLAKQSRRYFECLGGGPWKGLTIHKSGSLLLAKGAQLEQLRSIARTLGNAGIGSRWISHREAERIVPALRGGDFSRGLFCPSDAMIELRPLLGGFVKSLRAMGIRVRTGMPLQSVRAEGGGFIVKAGGRTFFAAKIVNAAGAWAGWVARRSRAMKVPLMPYRRHLFASPGPAVKWPFVWDVSHDFYFRPNREGLVLSPCDRAPEKLGDRKEKTRLEVRDLLRKKLGRFSGELSRLSIGRAKSGLRTLTPDGRFVIGEDPLCRNFYWVAGLGGHGVTTCFSVGRLAADLILGKKTDKKTARALSPARFLK